MKLEFTAEFFRGNREKLRELFAGTAPIVLAANGLLQCSTSSTYPFVQDGNFWYLTGIDEPNLILVLDKNKEYIILPELSHYQEVFDGSSTPEELARLSGIETILSSKDGWRQLNTRLKRVKHIATIAAPAAFVATYGMYTNPARADIIKKIKNSNPAVELLDLSQHLQRMRMVKQPIEVDMISRAISATIAGIEFVEKKYRKKQYAHEFDVELDLSRQFWKQGAQKQSFEPIIASGERGLTT